jgi:ribosomal protein S18 acetylase RimI-like enzyme
MSSLTVRRATAADRGTLAEYNRRMAWETEHKRLDEAVLARGVAAVFADPAKGFYLVAEDGGEVVGQLMVTTEWSDWRNGWFWWVQSVYVREEARRRGVFRALFAEVVRLGREAGDVVGVRLYVERDNASAQRTYRSLGMNDAGYFVYELSPLEVRRVPSGVGGSG